MVYTIASMHAIYGYDVGAPFFSETVRDLHPNKRGFTFPI
jgi:hypothetical protein